MSIGYIKQSAASVPTPPAGELNTFIDSADDLLKTKNSLGVVLPVDTGSSVSADLVSLTPAGDIVATNVEDAIYELDAEKAPITHVGSTGISQHGIATVSAAGFMSPADKTKLDSINLGDIQGSLNFKGLWNATTNAPALVSSVGTKGHYYVVSVQGSTNLDGITDWKVNDWAIFNGTVWQKLDDSETVVSVNGYTGAVVLAKADVGLNLVDNTSDLGKPISTATQTALNLKENAGVTINQLTGEATAGPGGGSQAVTLSNAAVIAKLLTGFAVDWNIVTSADSLLSAIQKLAGRSAMSLNTVSSDVTVPSGYTWIRQNRTVFSGATKITIASGGKITFIN